jgi:hypothetical protein
LCGLRRATLPDVSHEVLHISHCGLCLKDASSTMAGGNIRHRRFLGTLASFIL